MSLRAEHETPAQQIIGLSVHLLESVGRDVFYDKARIYPLATSRNRASAILFEKLQDLIQKWIRCPIASGKTGRVRKDHMRG